VKGEMVGSLVLGPEGSPVANPRFTVGSVTFNALVAFNLSELSTVIGNDALRDEATELAGLLDRRWDPVATTWVDDSERPGSAAAPTAEALLPALVSRDAAAVDAAFAALTDALAFGTRFGPAGVHVADPAFSATTYWRGPAWPQITYLLALAARRRGRPEAARLATALVEGAVASGFAEYWNPDTGEGLGAVPQSWTALAAVAESWLRTG
jgi:glycogen debranching enzyme